MSRETVVSTFPVNPSQLAMYENKLHRATFYKELSEKERKEAQEYLDGIVGPLPENKFSFTKLTSYQANFSEDKKSLVLTRLEYY